MEIIIIICLLLAVVLLLKDKLATHKPVRQQNNLSNLPDIMGRPKSVEGHSVPKGTDKGQTSEPDTKPDNFDSETSEKDFEGQIPQEELEDVLGSVPVWEEEDEWNEYGNEYGDNGFATGVTFEELSTVGVVLRQNTPEPALQEKAVDIVQRLQGTELFSLLENSMEGASKKIAALLDKGLSSRTDSGSSNLRNDDLAGFDIGEFV